MILLLSSLLLFAGENPCDPKEMAKTALTEGAVAAAEQAKECIKETYDKVEQVNQEAQEYFSAE